MTFKELEVGQRFRIVRGGRDVEWLKIEPVLFPAGHVSHNAVRVGGEQKMNYFGHSTKVLVPPYGDTTQADRQQKRYHRLKSVVQAAGWSSVAELETAYLSGVVAVPKKP